MRTETIRARLSARRPAGTHQEAQYTGEQPRVLPENHGADSTLGFASLSFTFYVSRRRLAPPRPAVLKPAQILAEHETDRAEHPGDVGRLNDALASSHSTHATMLLASAPRG